MGAQLQGETGGVAHHYFYRCDFENTVRGDPRTPYKDSGHGFRTNGACRGLVFEHCSFQNNGGDGLQLGGRDVDALDFVRSAITGNSLAAVVGPHAYSALQLSDCTVQGNKSDQLPAAKPFASAAPTADFVLPAEIHAGQPAVFRSTSRATSGRISEQLWDFGDGIPEVTAMATIGHDEDHNHDTSSLEVPLAAGDRSPGGSEVLHHDPDGCGAREAVRSKIAMPAAAEKVQVLDEDAAGPSSRTTGKTTSPRTPFTSTAGDRVQRTAQRVGGGTRPSVACGEVTVCRRARSIRA